MRTHSWVAFAALVILGTSLLACGGEKASPASDKSSTPISNQAAPTKPIRAVTPTRSSQLMIDNKFIPILMEMQLADEYNGQKAPSGSKTLIARFAYENGTSEARSNTQELSRAIVKDKKGTEYKMDLAVGPLGLGSSANIPPGFRYQILMWGSIPETANDLTLIIDDYVNTWEFPVNAGGKNDVKLPTDRQPDGGLGDVFEVASAGRFKPYVVFKLARDQDGEFLIEPRQPPSGFNSGSIVYIFYDLENFGEPNTNPIQQAWFFDSRSANSGYPKPGLTPVGVYTARLSTDPGDVWFAVNIGGKWFNYRFTKDELRTGPDEIGQALVKYMQVVPDALIEGNVNVLKEVATGTELSVEMEFIKDCPNKYLTRPSLEADGAQPRITHRDYQDQSHVVVTTKEKIIPAGGTSQLIGDPSGRHEITYFLVKEGGRWLVEKVGQEGERGYFACLN